MRQSFVTYHIDAVNGTQFKALVFRVQNDVHHGAHLRWNYIVRRYECHSFLEPGLKGAVGTLNARLNHVACHKLESLFQMLSEFFVRPMQITNEGLESIEFPEKVFGCSASIAFALPSLLFEAFVNRLSYWRFHQIHITHNQRSKCVTQMLMETTIFQIICQCKMGKRVNTA